jgi:hypothetical protein
LANEASAVAGAAEGASGVRAAAGAVAAGDTGKDRAKESGGKPAFLTLRLLNLLDAFTLKAILR